MDALIEGPLAVVKTVLALDTGASMSIIQEDLLMAAGYVPAAISPTVNMHSASGTTKVPKMKVITITALDVTLHNFELLSHQFPSTATVDGLLGLDFLKRCRLLTIDFDLGLLELQ